MYLHTYSSAIYKAKLVMERGTQYMYMHILYGLYVNVTDTLLCVIQDERRGCFIFCGIGGGSWYVAAVHGLTKLLLSGFLFKNKHVL